MTKYKESVNAIDIKHRRISDHRDLSVDMDGIAYTTSFDMGLT